ncbi:ATP-binding cassette domain-containing protein, partial [Paracoccaceae bacterium]|nr:ATP-binding cassette domain-containing protein [Paracoccaceae bacterium]
LSCGSISFDDKTIKTLLDQQTFLKKIGVCFQSNALFDSYKVWENIAFKSLYSKGKSDVVKLKKLAISKLISVGLNKTVAELYPSELSGGMQKRVGIARAIFSNPEILIFDEPTTGLDPIMSSKIINLIGKLMKNSEKSAITITHDINLAMFLASKIVLINEGRIEWSGIPSKAPSSKNRLLKKFLNDYSG